MKIYCLGSLNIDYVYQVPHFVRPEETLSSETMNIFPGGKGLNQSVALGKAGASVVHGGIINRSDEFLTSVLDTAKVDISRIKTTDTPTGHAIIQVEQSGQNSILLYPGANHKFTQDYIEYVLGDAAQDDMILIQNEINCLDIVFDVAHRKKMQIALNPSPFDKKLLTLPLSQVTWWIFNEIEGRELTGKSVPAEIVSAMYEKFPDSNILLTLGDKGCLFKNAFLDLFQPAYRTTAIDTTAAGDTFTGYFLAMVAESKSLSDALKIASYAASLAVSRAGSSESIPYLKEVTDACVFE